MADALNKDAIVSWIMNEFGADFSSASSVLRIALTSNRAEDFEVLLNHHGMVASPQQSSMIFHKIYAEKKVMAKRPRSPEMEFEYNEECPLFLQGLINLEETSPVKTHNHLLRVASARTVQLKYFPWPKSIESMLEVRAGQRSMKGQLPIMALEKQIAKELSNNQVLVVIGDLGTGKCNTLARFLADVGYTMDNGRGIVCTVPEFKGVDLAIKKIRVSSLGYSVGMKGKVAIKCMPEDALIRQIALDETLSKFSAIVVNQVDERRVRTDILLGILKKLLARRPEMRLIVASSATTEMYLYFPNSKVLSIPRSDFDVEVLYSNHSLSEYISVVVSLVMEIHSTNKMGDIIVFLAAEEELESASLEIKKLLIKSQGDNNDPQLNILKINPRSFEHSASSSSSIRNVILTTNITKALMEFDRIMYAIDCGFEKKLMRDPKTEIESAVISPISQDLANRRASWAGHVDRGRCYRIYTKAEFDGEMCRNSVPEICRRDLGDAVLRLKASGLKENLLSFNFLDPPPARSMINAHRQLYFLGALDKEGVLTKTGEKFNNCDNFYC